jgi:hypothetical protein
MKTDKSHTERHALKEDELCERLRAGGFSIPEGAKVRITTVGSTINLYDGESKPVELSVTWDESS